MTAPLVATPSLCLPEIAGQPLLYCLSSFHFPLTYTGTADSTQSEFQHLSKCRLSSRLPAEAPQHSIREDFTCAPFSEYRREEPLHIQWILPPQSRCFKSGESELSRIVVWLARVHSQSIGNPQSKLRESFGFALTPGEPSNKRGFDSHFITLDDRAPCSLNVRPSYDWTILTTGISLSLTPAPPFTPSLPHPRRTANCPHLWTALDFSLPLL